MLAIEDLTVSYGATVAVDGVTLDAGDREVLGIIGPSGCGKSTLLRAVAGLVRPRAGTIRIDGDPVDGLRPDQRGVGLMFQDHALFPHRNVGDNVAFGPRMQGLARDEVRARVTDALTLVDLDGTERRPVTQLSGGEQQRVALARAIAPRPRLLLLDEPLGSLDRALRDRLLDDLPALFTRIGTTVVYVTHDQDEAVALCDRIAVMRAGNVEQAAAPETLWRAPATTDVARFLGLQHLLEGHVTSGTIATGLGPVTAPDLADGPATVVLHPDALRLVASHDRAAPRELVLPGEVDARRFAGDHVRLRVDTDAGVPVWVPAWRGPVPQVGHRVLVAFDPDAVHVLPAAGAPRRPNER